MKEKLDEGSLRCVGLNLIGKRMQEKLHMEQIWLLIRDLYKVKHRVFGFHA